MEQLPKTDLLRALPAMTEDLFELRASEGGMPTLVGHFAVFNQWTEINSSFEGHFLERIAPTAFNKTFKENRANMRVLFQHGKDPQIGEKVLGPIRNLRATEHGGAYEVPLFDTSYNADLIPGLREGSYGSSFRFSVVKEEFNRSPDASEFNPTALPERTIEEARVSEFGPVTFPAYPGADAGLRSLTDWHREQSLRRQLEEFLGRRAAALEPDEPVEPAKLNSMPDGNIAVTWVKDVASYSERTPEIEEGVAPTTPLDDEPQHSAEEVHEEREELPSWQL